MTGKEVLNMACHIVHETDTTPYEALAVTWINVLLAELYDIANDRLEYAGSVKMSAVPSVTSLDEDLPYDAELTVKVMPKGLVSRLFAEELDYTALAMYKQEYQLAANECDRGIMRVIK